MRSPAEYIAATSTPEAAVALALSEAEKYRQLLLRAIRNTPPPALSSITPAP